MSRNEITIINPGWDYVMNKMPVLLSEYAAKGYIPVSMTDKEIRFKRSEPCSMSFRIIRSRTVHGEPLCSFGEYHLFMYPKETAERSRLILTLIISGAGTVLTYLISKDSSSQLFSAVSAGFTAALSMLFVYSAVRLRKIHNTACKHK